MEPKEGGCSERAAWPLGLSLERSSQPLASIQARREPGGQMPLRTLFCLLVSCPYFPPEITKQRKLCLQLREASCLPRAQSRLEGLGRGRGHGQDRAP